MEDQKYIDDTALAEMALGTVTNDVKGKNWVFIGTCRIAKSPRNYIFVMAGNPSLHYSCAYVETLVKKFPSLAGVA